jgi:MYXO-CTERM domain-containing protein
VLRALFTTIPLLLVARTSFADCVDPYSCICPSTAGQLSEIWEGTVNRSVPGASEATIRVTQVIQSDGGSEPGSPHLGQERTIPNDGTIVRDTQVLVATDDSGAILSPIVPIRADGQVGCKYLEGWSVTEDVAISAMIHPTCSAFLDEHGFVTQPCDDTPGGCNCNSTSEGPGLLALLLLARALRLGFGSAEAARSHHRADLLDHLR